MVPKDNEKGDTDMDTEIIAECGTTVSHCVLSKEELIEALKGIKDITIWNDYGRFDVMLDEWLANDEDGVRTPASFIDASIDEMVIILSEYVTGVGIQQMHPSVLFGDEYGTDLSVRKMSFGFYADNCGHSHDCCGCTTSGRWDLIPVDGGKLMVGTYTHNYNN
jgi:hypothetical protein